MLRRKPTRIELKMDDLEEYKKMKEENEAKIRMEKGDINITPGIYRAKSRRDEINARIGYDPKPLPQPSTLPH